jgi:hypothetical protein
MSNRAKWMTIAAVAVVALVAGWTGRGALWHWLLALHGQGMHH